MNILTVDVENTITVKEYEGKKKRDMTPYCPTNRLVSVGRGVFSGGTFRTAHDFLYHRDPLPRDPAEVAREIQAELDAADLVVGFNVRHDMAWLQESGFTYNGPVSDLMVTDYVLSRGQHLGWSLEEVAAFHGVALKRKDLVQEYYDRGIGMDEIPQAIVEEYCVADIVSTFEGWQKVDGLYQLPANKILIPTRDMSNEFCAVLIDVERNGIAIDEAVLEAVRLQYVEEQTTLKDRLTELAESVMGDTPIKLSSPEQLSRIIFSRRVLDKKLWAEVFHIGTNDRGKPLRRPQLPPPVFNKEVRRLSTVLRRTRAAQCPTCVGAGFVRKIKKDGTEFKNTTKCKGCEGGGILYEDTNQTAGFKLLPRDIHDCTSNGFSTDKETLQALVAIALDNGNAPAVEFLTGMIRLNAVDTYLSSFVGGIARGVQPDGVLHPRLNQCITATARLSGSEPNLQNQPRAKTFPVRRVFKSRWEGGSILEGDEAQLEFRVAGELSGDPQIRADVEAGADVHAFTSQTLTEAGQTTDRQGAKPHTFKPLYGGTSGSRAEVAYYTAFGIKYAGVTKWHIKLQQEALRTGMITLPTGRQYLFPNVRRTAYGCTNATQIKNYPVQGYATADIVPVAMILLYRSMKLHKVKSVLINTVHDSVVADVYPGEEQLMCRLMYDAFMAVIPEMWRRYRVRFKMPLAVELKIGPNWLDMHEVDLTTLPPAPFDVSLVLSPQWIDPDALDDPLPF